MIDATTRWVARAIAVLILGPIAARAAGMVLGADGSEAASMLTGNAVAPGLVALAVVGVCTLAAAGVAARLADRHEGVLCAALVLGWVAWSGGRLGETYRLAPEVGTLARLSFEGAAVLVIAVASWVVADRLSRRDAKSEGLTLSTAEINGLLRGKAGVPVLLTGLVCGLGCVWLFARHDHPGQGLGAAFLGGVAAGVLGSLVLQSVIKESREVAAIGVGGVFVPATVGVMLGAVVGPLVGIGVPGTGKIVDAVVRGDLPGWLAVSPASWVAGALIGVPAGISMMRSATQEPTKAPAKAAG